MSALKFEQLPGCRLFSQTLMRGKAGDSWTFPIEGQEHLVHQDEHWPFEINPQIPRAVTHTCAAMISGLAKVKYPSFDPYDIGPNTPIGWNPYTPTLMSGPREPMTVTAETDDFLWWCIVPAHPTWRLEWQVVSPGDYQTDQFKQDPLYVVPLDPGVSTVRVPLNQFEIGGRAGGGLLTLNGPADARVVLVWRIIAPPQ